MFRLQIGDLFAYAQEIKNISFFQKFTARRISVSKAFKVALAAITVSTVSMYTMVTVTGVVTQPLGCLDINIGVINNMFCFLR